MGISVEESKDPGLEQMGMWSHGSVKIIRSRYSIIFPVLHNCQDRQDGQICIGAIIVQGVFGALPCWILRVHGQSQK